MQHGNEISQGAELESIRESQVQQHPVDRTFGSKDLTESTQMRVLLKVVAIQ